ncbi:hypothetical protein HN028_13325 [Pantoea ananatis]|uniref:hypothetical protein n=1 Tax=Pantoea ananas TaxID=553 RepID=UPI00352A7ADA
MKKKSLIKIIFLIISLQFSSTSYATSTYQDSVNDGCEYNEGDDGDISGSCAFSSVVLLKTKLEVGPWCILNNNDFLNAVFDSVDPNKISSLRYVKELNYDFACSDSTLGYNVFFNLDGVSANGFNDNKTIATTVDGLGMQILMDGTPMSLRQSKAINMASPPKLEVLLVKLDNKILEGDKFSGTANMTVLYD